MKEQILKLRKEGKTYNEIVATLGCSKGTISYHCGKGQKDKTLQRQKKRRFNKRRILLKKLYDFISREIKIKTRDFQRRRTPKGYWDGKGIADKNFKVETLIKKVMENPICYLTGEEIDFSDSGSFSFDHIIPVSKGGNSTLSNLGLCIKNANMSKYSMELDEYIELCKKVLINFGYKIDSK